MSLKVNFAEKMVFHEMLQNFNGKKKIKRVLISLYKTYKLHYIMAVLDQYLA